MSGCHMAFRYQVLNLGHEYERERQQTRSASAIIVNVAHTKTLEDLALRAQFYRELARRATYKCTDPHTHL